MVIIFRKIFFILAILIFIIGGVFLFSQNSKSYDDQTTHPGLTDEVVDFYNLSFDNKLTAQEKEWIVQGAMNEDTPPRWINHFYDPIYKDGWSGEETGIWPTLSIQYLSSVLLSSEKPVSSLNWIHNQELQSKYGAYQGNRTWERAIYEMVKNGNKREAYYTLGFILHLIEDATVPDHTRNDTHAHELRFMTGDYGSPYEEFSKQYTRETLNIAKEFKQKGDQPIARSSINDYLISLAEYSNKYFFSKDTINDTKYEFPKIIKEENSFGYGKDSDCYSKNPERDCNLFPIVKIKIRRLSTFEISKEYLLKNEFEYHPILNAYFFRLSRAAVLNGAGVINLFNQEVTKAEKEKLQELPRESSAIWSVFGRGTQIYNFVSSVFDDAINEIVAVIDKADDVDPMANVASIGQIATQTESKIMNQELRDSSAVKLSQNNPLASNEQLTINSEQLAISLPIQGDQQPVQIQQPEIIHAPYYRVSEIIHVPYGGDKVDINQNAPIIPVFTGGGGGSAGPSFGSSNNEQIEASNQQSNDTGGGDISEQIQNDNQQETNNGQTNPPTDQPTVTEDLTPPPAPTITTNSGADYIIKKFTSQYPERKISLALEGMKSQDTSEILINDSAEGVNYPTETSWKKDFILSEGDNIFEARAKDIAGNISELTTIKITLQFSDIEFYLTNYNVRQFNFTLNWQDSLGTVDNWQLQYKLAPNFDWIVLANSSSLIANSFDFTAKYDDLTYYFRIQGSDINGNLTDWQYLQADISSKPVVINEVAWMGTQASTTDEWIELANKTDQEIDLSDWILKTSDGAISIKLTGKIAPNSFYLLERTNDDPVGNILANQIYTGVLNNPTGSYDYGQNLQLYDKNSNEIDSAYTAHAGSNDASVPNNPIRKTSERISIWVAGNIKSNWKTYQGVGGGAQDASGNIIFGTPKSKNSQADSYYLLGVNNQINSDVVILQKRGVVLGGDYAVDVASGKSVMIEPGAILKFGSSYGGLNIYGSLIAKGTAENKIIFTSISDDEYGGDTDSNGASTISNWMKIYFKENSSGEFTNAIIRYGGNDCTISVVCSGTNSGAVYINKASVKISSSIIENMGKDALHFDNSDVDISNSEFKNNKINVVYVYQGKGNVTDSIFDNNKGIGVYVSDSSGRTNISSNNFMSNKAPIQIDKFADFNISDNIISKNTYNGIYVYGNANISASENSVTLSADMPFLFDGNGYVDAGKILNVSPGTIFKIGSMFQVSGTLNAIGTAEKPIIFTALTDDQYGGDSNNDGNASVPTVGSWYWIQFAGGDNSVLDNVIVRYAGRLGYSMGGPPSGGSGISVDSGVSNFILRNSIVSDSAIGMTVSSNSAIIENSTFANNKPVSDNGGIFYRGGVGLDVVANNVTVNNVVFNNNGKAFQSSSAYMATILLSDLIFNQNIYNYWPEGLLP